VTLLSIFDAVEAMLRPLQPAARSCASWLSKRLPIGGYAGIADEPLFGVNSIISYGKPNLLIGMTQILCRIFLNFAPPDACIMKQKLLNPPGDSEGQAGVEALRVALNC
jgi:hypothetical protein